MATATDAVRSNGAVAPPSSGWQVALGIVLIVAGFLAVMMPVVAALATALVFAWLVVIAGVCEIIYAVQTRQGGGFGWKLAAGIVMLLLGIALLLFPLASVASLALVVGAFLFLSGIMRTLLAWRMRPQRGWGWILFDGLLSVVLAILIVVGWPQSSLAIIGVLTGLSLMSAGLWRIMFACRTAS